MVMENDEQIKNNFNRFMELVNTDERAEKLNVLYEDFGQVLLEAPASSRSYYHNAFPGGYLDHVLHVYDASIKVVSAYKAIGGDIDFTKQELTFAVLHHDLGKLGSSDGPYYLDQDSDWHRKRGELYKRNESIQFMTVTDRALYLLQRYGITVTEKEYLAIKLSDGLYEEGNQSYLKNPKPNPMKTNLPHIVHWADHMACAAEHDAGRF